jgi:hypothetical protein
MSLLAKSLSRPTLKSSVSRSRTVSVQARRTVKPSKGSTPDSAWVSLALRGRPRILQGFPSFASTASVWGDTDAPPAGLGLLPLTADELRHRTPSFELPSHLFGVAGVLPPFPFAQRVHDAVRAQDILRRHSPLFTATPAAHDSTIPHALAYAVRPRSSLVPRRPQR